MLKDGRDSIQKLLWTKFVTKCAAFNLEKVNIVGKEKLWAHYLVRLFVVTNFNPILMSGMEYNVLFGVCHISFEHHCLHDGQYIFNDK